MTIIKQGLSDVEKDDLISEWADVPYATILLPLDENDNPIHEPNLTWTVTISIDMSGVITASTNHIPNNVTTLSDGHTEKTIRHSDYTNVSILE